MKKKVNGHVVDIWNMDTIEKGFEGLAMARRVSSGTTDKLVEDSEEFINKWIEAYDEVYKSLPFPLYAVEEDIKYAMIGTYIQDAIKEPLKMWVSHGLVISIDGTRAVKFAGATWAVVSIDGVCENNTNIELYRNSIGYKEYEWALSMLLDDKDLKGYYARFMPGFVKACNDEPIVLKWELSNLLNFGSVPQKIDISWGRLVNIQSQSEYMLDIFASGIRETGASKTVVDLTKGKPSISTVRQTGTEYNFEVLEKKHNENNDLLNPESIKKVQTGKMDGMAAVFQTIVGLASLRQDGSKPEYRGVIDGNTAIYEVDGTVYKCNVAKYQKAERIGAGLSIYTYGSGYVYLSASKQLPSGVTKKSIYAYRVSDGAILLCRVAYE